MSAKVTNCDKNPKTIAGRPVFESVFSKRESFSQQKYGTANRAQLKQHLLKKDQGWEYLGPKVMHYDHKQQALFPINAIKPIITRVNIHETLPTNVRALRFNQREIADRFGSFTDFVKGNKHELDEVKNSDLLQLLEKPAASSSFGRKRI